MNRFVEFEDVDLTIDEHHAHPAYGSTGLKRFLSDSAPTQGAADMGNALHTIVVDREPSKVAMRPVFKGEGARTWQPKQWAEEHPDVVYAFPPAEYRKVIGMADALKNTKSLMQLLDHPAVQVEHTVLATTDTGIQVKSRVDIRAPGYLSKPIRILTDIKTTGEPDDDGFARACASYGYDPPGRALRRRRRTAPRHGRTLLPLRGSQGTEPGRQAPRDADEGPR